MIDGANNETNKTKWTHAGTHDHPASGQPQKMPTKNVDGFVPPPGEKTNSLILIGPEPNRYYRSVSPPIRSKISHDPGEIDQSRLCSYLLFLG